MSLLQDPQTTEARRPVPVVRRPSRHRPLTAAGAERHDIDLTDDEAGTPHHPGSEEHPPDDAPLVDPTGRVPWRGMRIRRVRLGSVAKLAAVFWFLGFAVLLGSAVVVWNVARAFGFITEIEDLVVTSLGLDAFEIDGSALFGVTAAATAFLSVVGWVMTVLMAAVYNASCAVFGGLAVETGPLQRRRRVFSLRHRRFVTIRS